MSEVSRKLVEAEILLRRAAELAASAAYIAGYAKPDTGARSTARSYAAEALRCAGSAAKLLEAVLAEL